MTDRQRLQPPLTRWAYLTWRWAMRIYRKHMGPPPLAWSMIAHRSNQSHQRLPQPLSSFYHDPIKKKIPDKGTLSSLGNPSVLLFRSLPNLPHPFLLNKVCFHSAYSHFSFNFHCHETRNSEPLSQVNFSGPWVSGTFLKGRPGLSAMGHLKVSLFLKDLHQLKNF